MPVMRITAHLLVLGAAGKLEYEDNNYRDRAGWKEIVVAPDKGASIRRSSAGTEDRSKALTVYPQDSTVSPPQVLKASVDWISDAPVRPKETPPVVVAKEVANAEPAEAPVATPLTPQASGTVMRGDFLSDLLSHKEISLSMILIGIAVAFGLGAMHAFSPGHGKTMVAAYLVGTRGTFKHAAFLGAMVTFTHTISVFALAFVTLFLSQYILPDKLYPVLGAISGLTIVWIGAMLFYKRARGLTNHNHHHSHSHDHSHDHAHAHSHDHGHSHTHTHDHHHHDHDHGPNGHSHVPEGEVTMGSLIALGASGGLVPCPSGLVLLLSAIAIGRIGLGIVLLVCFSAGLAVVLTLIGVLVVYAKSWLPDPQAAARNPAFRYIPVASAAVIVVVGVVLTSVSLGWIQPGRLIG
jgi:ABC-type nickel/cobalt efflux system permease component RcnA